jgi:hypothetical protein
MVFIHPERVLREAHGVHCGEAPRAAASFNPIVQRGEALIPHEWWTVLPVPRVEFKGHFSVVIGVAANRKTIVVAFALA